jgi:hypothetical protein
VSRKKKEKVVRIVRKLFFGKKQKQKVAIFRQWVCTCGQNQAGFFFLKSTLLSDLWLNLAIPLVDDDHHLSTPT